MKALLIFIVLLAIIYFAKPFLCSCYESFHDQGRYMPGKRRGHNYGHNQGFWSRSYPWWWYADYVNPVAVLPTYLSVNDDNLACKTKCFNKYKDVESADQLSSEEVEGIKKCLKNCN